MEDVEDPLVEGEAILMSLLVEHAQVDAGGVLCPEGDVRPSVAVGGDAEGIPSQGGVAGHAHTLLSIARRPGKRTAVARKFPHNGTQENRVKEPV
jgi:hypothetical protein